MVHIVEFQKKYALKPDGIIGKEVINKMCEVFGISNNAQIAHFLANADHETGGFKTDTENLNYSANRLVKIWPSRFAGPDMKPNDLAKKLANHAEAIANNVYAGRMGNGSESSGDGWRYRGRGAIQLTGKKNYKQFSEFMNDRKIMTNPETVAMAYFWHSAVFYFTTNKLWDKMKGCEPCDVKNIRKAVNGGYIGLENVQKKFLYYHNLIRL
ncbi:glycoside hydrolase family 19 protein [Flavobacterium sp. MFBS3-15]|uniref:glycoside hydrolase family 19 protein n=1 Tax=Flavobacterium sp. MFBS3-15 TaxID=2989816 RepID=UPI0022359548|nr:glycoside hydrolase family 19 protein [Flavobacterium sp. MFBS3-15]MCW4470619.1 glycoside hydrolase family 19 protein [Flavobacterium sp. MFBS3-15]